MSCPDCGGKTMRCPGCGAETVILDLRDVFHVGRCGLCRSDQDEPCPGRTGGEQTTTTQGEKR